MKLFKSILSTIMLTISPLVANAYYHLSPYCYCGNNPVNYTDPTGCTVEGATKKDAALVAEDFRAMFPGDEFSDFRDLIVQNGKKQNGKSLAPISQEALSAAFDGITLNEDQQALVDIVVNTINSSDIHVIEYLSPGRDMSSASLKIYEPIMNQLGITASMADNMSGGYTGFIKALCGEASTTPTGTGSLTLIQWDPNSFLTNRPATLGHEVFGHGRSYRLGYTDSQSQHVIPIQIENMILRCMGQSLFRNGTDHAPLKTHIPNFMSLPICR